MSHPARWSNNRLYGDDRFRACTGWDGLELVHITPVIDIFLTQFAITSTLVRLLVAVLFLAGDVETTPDCRGWEGGTVIFLKFKKQ